MDIETLREFCLSLPETTEGIKYGDQLCFIVNGKTFCSSNTKFLDKANFYVAEADFLEICERPGIGPAPYGGAKFNVVQVAGFDYLTDAEWLFFVKNSYDLNFEKSKKGKKK